MPSSAVMSHEDVEIMWSEWSALNVAIYYHSDIHFSFSFELPGINAFNFVLKNALGGGGVASLRSDPQVIYMCKLM